MTNNNIKRSLFGVAGVFAMLLSGSMLMGCEDGVENAGLSPVDNIVCTPTDNPNPALVNGWRASGNYNEGQRYNITFDKGSTSFSISGQAAATFAVGTTQRLGVGTSQVTYN